MREFLSIAVMLHLSCSSTSPATDVNKILFIHAYSLARCPQHDVFQSLRCSDYKGDGRRKEDR
jgi:hypothetical protein